MDKRGLCCMQSNASPQFCLSENGLLSSASAQACHLNLIHVCANCQVHRQHIRGILEAVADNAHYPESSSAEALTDGAAGVGSAAADPDALEASEAEAAVAERRAELFVLFRNAAKVAPEEGYAVVGSLLQRLVSQPSTGFQALPLTMPVLLCSFASSMHCLGCTLTP